MSRRYSSYYTRIMQKKLRHLLWKFYCNLRVLSKKVHTHNILLLILLIVEESFWKNKYKISFRKSIYIIYCCCIWHSVFLLVKLSREIKFIHTRLNFFSNFRSNEIKYHWFMKEELLYYSRYLSSIMSVYSSTQLDRCFLLPH